MPADPLETKRAPVAALTASPHARLARYAAIGALLLGVLGDALLRDGPWGAGLAVWMAALAALAVALLLHSGNRPSSETYVWIAAALLLSSTFVWRDADALLTLVNLLAMLAALVLTAVSAAGASELGIRHARLRDLFRAAARTIAETAAGPVRLIGCDAELREAFRPDGERQLPRLGRALLITLPLAAVFGGLLIHADPLFGSLLIPPHIDLGALTVHVVVTCFFAWIVSGWLRGSLFAGREGRLDYSAEGGQARAPSSIPARNAAEPAFTLGSTDVTLALGTLNVLFAAFVLVQLQWLFGGEALVLRTTGMGYAEYARHGFFELTAVAALLLPVLLGAHALIPADNAALLRRYRRLALPLIALLGAVMLSAGARMQLYVHYYGLSLDRLYACAFMVWLALVFVWFGLTILRGASRRFALGFVAGGFAVLALLNIANPDALVARTNLARAESAIPGTAGADFPYVAALGGDAVPILVNSLLKRATGAGEALTAPECLAVQRLLGRWGRGSRHETDRGWARWNLARSRALAAVRRAAPRLRELCAAR